MVTLAVVGTFQASLAPPARGATDGDAETEHWNTTLTNASTFRLEITANDSDPPPRLETVVDVGRDRTPNNRSLAAAFLWGMTSSGWLTGVT